MLGALTAVAPLATDMYVPGFPALGRTLHASSSAVQLTMTAFLGGLVIGQLIIGPISDSIGRRRLLIGGTLGFTLFSVLCAIAPRHQAAHRGALPCKGVTGAGGMVLARAVLTDRFHGVELPRYMALLSQIMGVAPVAAPILGGAVLQSVSTWRTVFLVLTAMGVALLLGVLGKVPESLPPERRQPDGVASTFRAMGSLLRHRAFMGYVLVLAFTGAALFTYIAGSSFVFEDLHGVSATTYSLVFATNAVGMLLAGAVFSRLAPRVRLNTLLTVAVLVVVAGAVARVVLRLALGETFAGTWCHALRHGQQHRPGLPGRDEHRPGDRPARSRRRLGAARWPTVPARCAGRTGLVELFGTGSSLPMAAIMLVAAACALLALLTLVRPWQGHGEPR